MTFPSAAKSTQPPRRRRTGPRTALGKARSSKNALRHGLAVPIGKDPQYEPVVAALTVRIAGPHADQRRLALARPVAEVVIDLARIRRAQRLHIAHAAELEHRISPLLPDPGLDRTSGRRDRVDGRQFLLSMSILTREQRGGIIRSAVSQWSNEMTRRLGRIRRYTKTLREKKMIERSEGLRRAHIAKSLRFHHAQDAGIGV